VTGSVTEGFAVLYAIRTAPQYSVSEPEVTTVPVLVFVTILQNSQSVIFEQVDVAQAIRTNDTAKIIFFFMEEYFSKYSNSFNLIGLRY
jgi:hypothetical protein